MPPTLSPGHGGLLIHLLLVAVLTATGSAAAAETVQDHDAIRAAAEQFMGQAVETPPGARSEISAGRLDPRLRLAPCDEPLEAFLPPSGRTVGNTTVGVRCNGERPWTLYVPVQVALHAPVLVATRPLARGARLAPEDIATAERDVAGLHSGYFSDPQRLVGQMLKRAVGAQTAFTPRLVEAPTLVERGQRVTLLAAGGGVQVRMTGTALDDGAEGERIKVRNLSSQRVVEGRVVDRGMVEVAL